MRARPAAFSPLLLALVALLAASCARELPTAARSSTQTRTASHRFATRDVGGEVVITIAPGADPDSVAMQYGATIVLWDPLEGVAALLPGASDTPATLIQRLASDPRVETSETNSYFEPAEARQKSFAFDDGHDTPGNYQAQPVTSAMHLDLAHQISGGEGMRIAILDTGIDPNHPAFTGRIAASWDFLTDQAGATDVAEGLDTNGDGVVDEAWGHGTHVAGIATLVAPAAKLLIGRVLDSDGQGDVVTVACGIRWAIANGARVINLSLGSYSDSPAIRAAVLEAQARGIVVVAAAGNMGAETPVEYPAAYPASNAIAATDCSATPASWTSYGSFIAVSAPGVAIRSAYPNNQYRLWSGTSMSVPFYAGAAALLLALHPGWQPADVLNRLAITSQHLNSVPAAEVGKLGAGMLDVGASLAPDAPDDTEPIVQSGHH